MTKSGLNELSKHSFPGNVRELSNILNRSILLTDTNTIDADHIEESLNIDSIDTDRNREQIESSQPLILLDLKAAEKKHLAELMIFFGNDKVKVAKTAGISLRSLYRKLECD